MKKTKRDYFNEILKIEGISDEIKTFVNAELALLDKKNSNRKPTKEQKANENYKEQIMSILSVGAENGITASEVHKAMNYDGDYQVQKTSALLAQLYKAEEIVKGTDGKKTVFYLEAPASDEDAEEPADAE